MTVPKHTPGPWTYRGTLGPRSVPSLKGPHVIETAAGEQIAIMSEWRSEATEANAALIARAPDMDAALRDCLALAARHRHEEWAQHVMRFCSRGGVVPSPLRGE